MRRARRRRQLGVSDHVAPTSLHFPSRPQDVGRLRFVRRALLLLDVLVAGLKQDLQVRRLLAHGVVYGAVGADVLVGFRLLDRGHEHGEVSSSLSDAEFGQKGNNGLMNIIF